MNGLLRSDKDCKLNIAQRVTLQSNITAGPECESITIGYGSYIGRDVYIGCKRLEIGEYSTIHHGCIIQGQDVNIGHNCWIGHYSVIDGTAGCDIENNVGIGTCSQLWTHMKFGDMLNGCRFNSSKRMRLEDDVWLVGHNILGPLHAKKGSMLLTGSVATKDMEANAIYSGNPARRREGLGGQFREVAAEVKMNRLERYIQCFMSESGNRIEFEMIEEASFCEDQRKRGVIQFDVESRKYSPTRRDDEFALIRYLLYDKAKFTPSIVSSHPKIS